MSGVVRALARVLLVVVLVAAGGRRTVAQIGPPVPPDVNREASAPQATLGNPIATTESDLTKESQATTTIPGVPRLPFEPLSPDQQRRLDSLLTYWEQHSNRIATFSCRFARYHYDNVFGPERDPREVAEGRIRYKTPDRGEFRVERIAEYQAPKESGQPPKYEFEASEDREHWICDGTSVYELNSREKQMIERKLPQHMQGRQIADGPLPFIFGASKAKIESRYWIREIVPQPPRPGEYWFEAYPKRADDAANFQRVTIILDEKTFLPKALQLFPPIFDGKQNLTRFTYTFSGHEVNSMSHRTQEFLQQFISPRVPVGWKRLVENFGEDHANAAPTAQRPDPANGRPASSPR